MTTPRSVRYINKWPSANSRFSIGTRLHQIIEFIRELHDSVSTGGTILTLVNELRTKLHTGGDVFALANELRTKLHTGGDVATLLNELRTDLTTAGDLFVLLTELHTRLHTGGDYQALISAIRGELIANGQLADRLIDLEDKAYNQILTDPGWQEDAVQTDFECANAINAVVNGVYVAPAVAATTTYSPTSPAWDTGVGQTRLVTLSTTGVANNITATIGAIDAVIPPRPPSGQCPIGIVHIPASFTGGVTQIVAGGVTFTDGFPRRLAVHTPIATANVAALAASAPLALTAAAVAAVTATAVSAVTASAMTTTALDKVESLPDRG